jgi:3-hydroxyacyl-[acyl-carrier-protein] dehydratase
MPILDISAIQALLPHRYPMLLVDRIIEMDHERIVGIKNVTANEPFLILGQIPDRENKLVFLASVERAKFRQPVVPGDQLRLEAVVLKNKVSVAKIAAKAIVDGHVVAEAELMCSLRNKTPEPEPALTL